MNLESSRKFSEISRAILELNSRRSPGIDGLIGECYRRFWNLIGQDFFYAVLLECVN